MSGNAPVNRSRVFTDDGMRDVLARRAAGESLAGIARTHGVSVRTVRRNLAYNGAVFGRRKPVPEDALDSIAREYAEGRPLRGLAAAYGHSTDSIIMHLIRRGIAVRKPVTHSSPVRPADPPKPAPRYRERYGCLEVIHDG